VVRRGARRKRVTQWLFVVTVLALFTGAPAYVRFVLFLPAMHSSTKAQWTSSTLPPNRGSGGVACPHGVWFPARVWDDRVPFTPAGFMYAPAGGPCRNGSRTGSRFRVWDDWYIVF
jgi:hypothetical protein